MVEVYVCVTRCLVVRNKSYVVYTMCSHEKISIYIGRQNLLSLEIFEKKKRSNFQRLMHQNTQFLEAIYNYNVRRNFGLYFKKDVSKNR